MKLTPAVPPDMGTATAQSGFLIELGEILSGQMTLPVDHECSGGNTPLKDSDKFLGTVPPGVTRLIWLAAHYYDRLHAEQKVAFEYSADGSASEANAQLLVNKYSDRANAYRAVFWSAVHDHYPPSGDYAGLTLRQGWAIIASPPKSNPLLDLLRKLDAAGRLKIEDISGGDDD